MAPPRLGTGQAQAGGVSGPDYWQAYEQQLHQQWLTARRGSPLHDDEDKHMKIGDMIESKYLKQSDIGSEEVPVTVKGIKKVNVARDDEDPEYRWTVSFMELPKPMVLNVTNLKRLAKALGDDTDGWIGNSVILYVDPDIEFGGNVVGGLRIKAMRTTAPAAKARAAINTDDVNRKLRDAETPTDDIPF